MPQIVTRRTVLAACLPLATGCAGVFDQPADNPALGDVTRIGNLRLVSPAFQDGDAIPDAYGKDGRNVNPPLSVGGVPDTTVSLVLIVDDPDAPSGTFTHWLVWNIPPGIDSLPEGWTPPDQVVEGENDFGNVGYDGPRPPSEHTYRFKLYALDTPLDLSADVSQQALGDAMDGHIEAQAQLTGTFAP